MNSKKKIGEIGEDLACSYLIKRGYKILERNYYKELFPYKGEIDIVAKKDKIICFIEVKTLYLKNKSDFFPEDKVNFKKQKQLINLSQIWLTDHKIPLDSKWQIDIISVILCKNYKKAKIKHFKNAIFQ